MHRSRRAPNLHCHGSAQPAVVVVAGLLATLGTGLRRSLGSILASALDLPAIDEVGLTQWMHAHLRVIAIPVDDPDILDDLETEILAELDPPLNLVKVSNIPLRA